MFLTNCAYFNFKPISGETIENVDWSQVNMIDIHIRPWVKLNGLINRKILDQLLTSILYHTLSHPGSTIAKITSYIQPALQPFHIRELLGKIFDANDYCKNSLRFILQLVPIFRNALQNGVFVSYEV